MFLQWLLFVFAFEKCGGRARVSAQDRRKCGYSHLNCESIKHEKCLGFAAFELGSVHLKLATQCRIMWVYTSGYNLGPIILHVVCKPLFANLCFFFWFMHLTNHNFQKVGGVLRCWSYSKGITKIHKQTVSINYKADAVCFILFLKTQMHKKENKGE